MAATPGSSWLITADAAARPAAEAAPAESAIMADDAADAAAVDAVTPPPAAAELATASALLYQ